MVWPDHFHRLYVSSIDGECWEERQIRRQAIIMHLLFQNGFNFFLLSYFAWVKKHCLGHCCILMAYPRALFALCRGWRDTSVRCVPESSPCLPTLRGICWSTTASDPSSVTSASRASSRSRPSRPTWSSTCLWSRSNARWLWQLLDGRSVHFNVMQHNYVGKKNPCRNQPDYQRQKTLEASQLLCASVCMYLNLYVFTHEIHHFKWYLFCLGVWQVFQQNVQSAGPHAPPCWQ